jgi:phenylacetate-CoA ligase
VNVTLLRRVAWSARLAAQAPLQARFPFRSPAAIERAQRHRIRRIVAHAHEHVPYYRETMRRLALAPGDVRSAADLAKLPLLERDDLQRDPEYFASRYWPDGACLRLRTGGSTGEPIEVLWDPQALVEIGAYRERLRSVLLTASHRRLRYREARVVSPLDASAATSRAFDATALLPRALRIDWITLSVLDPPEINLPRLNAYRPDVVSAYGSYVESLFAHVAATGRPFHRPSAVVYGADPLSDRMRAMISEMGIGVFSAYASIEAFNIAFECERHTGMHLNDDLAPVRVLDGDGREQPPGESGEIVVSNLVNRGTVLLNYRLDDIAAKLPGRCACGRNLPRLSLLEGRGDEWVQRASGERVHPQWVRAPLSGDPAVWRYQVVQPAPGRLRVEIVADPAGDEAALRSRVTRELEGRLGDGAHVTVDFVDSLPRSARGKVRPVMSLQARERLERP